MFDTPFKIHEEEVGIWITLKGTTGGFYIQFRR